MAVYNYVVIGGGLAGGRAVEGIRQVDEDGTIVLITEESYRPYERPPLSKKYLQSEAGLDRVFLRDESYYEERNIEIIQEKKVLHLIPAEKKVLAEDGLELSYEKLLLATGGQAIRLDLPGNNLSNVFTLRTINDSQSIRDAAGNGKTALVMGGSFIGTEVTASLTQLGTKVVQIFPENRLLERVVPQEGSDYLFDLFTGKGVHILPGVVASQLNGENRVQSAALDNGEKMDVDLVVMGIGIRLNTELAEEAGLSVRDSDKAVVVDKFLQTTDPDIYAAGDIAAWPDVTFEQRLRVEHWDVARRQGRRAGRNMAGENEPYTTLPYFFSDLFDLSFEVWGNLSAWDQTVTRGSVESGSFAFYYFYSGRLVGVFAADRPGDEREPMQALVKAQPHYLEVAELLQKDETDLSELAGLKPEPEKQGSESDKLSFAEDIAPLFREKDVAEMKEISEFDLSKYEDVKERADLIYERLLDETMPCDEPWSEDQIDTFKRWMEGGKHP